MPCDSPPPGDLAALRWFQGNPAPRSGLRDSGGGVHLSKTMMLTELSLLLDAIALEPDQRGAAFPVRAAIERLVLEENILTKRTRKARSATLKKLAELYGLYGSPTVTQGLLALWPRDAVARPLLALLCALSRDPLLRRTAAMIIDAEPGEAVPSAAVREMLLSSFPERFSASTMAALAERCAATWGQSGHLGRPPKRERRLVRATPTSVAYAVQIAKLAGFSGEAALSSPWVKVLDLDVDGAAHLARRAEAEGLLRIRSAGHVYDLEVRGDLAKCMGDSGGDALI